MDMKRSITLIGVVAVLSAWGLEAGQAQALPAGPTAQISAVDVAWTAQGQIRISWSENTPVANTIKLNDEIPLGTTSAAGANELVVDAAALGHTSNPADAASITVTDPEGGSSFSRIFDRYLPDPPVLMSVSPEGRATWSVEAEPPLTANDPLDLEGTTTYKVTLVEEGAAHTCQNTLLSDSTATSGTIPKRAKPYHVHVVPRNEWGTGEPGQTGPVRISRLTITAPALPQYGTSVTITGMLVESSLLESSQPTQCNQIFSPGGGQGVILHARNTPTKPWYVVTTTTTTSSGKYRFTVKNPGAREYRVIRRTLQRTMDFVYGTSTPAKLVKATTRVMSAKFITPVISFGAKPQAYLWVDPAGSQRAALQFKNASGAWQGVLYKTLSSGRGLATFNWNRRGTTRFRWWVPGSRTTTGLKVDPVYTSSFTLTVK